MDSQRHSAARAWLSRLLAHGERAGSAPPDAADRRRQLAERAVDAGVPVLDEIAARRKGGRS